MGGRAYILERSTAIHHSGEAALIIKRLVPTESRDGPRRTQPDDTMSSGYKAHRTMNQTYFTFQRFQGHIASYQVPLDMNKRKKLQGVLNALLPDLDCDCNIRVGPKRPQGELSHREKQKIYGEDLFVVVIPRMFCSGFDMDVLPLNPNSLSLMCCVPLLYTRDMAFGSLKR